MAHQAHVLPWNTVASHLKFVPPPVHPPTGRAGIAPRDKPTQSKELHHFARVFTTQISEFSRTERLKYASTSELKRRAATWLESSPDPDLGPVSEPPPPIAPPPKKSPKAPQDLKRRRVYSSALEEKYDLRHQPQNIQTWISDAKKSETNPQGGYSTRDGDLADTVKALMTEAALLPSRTSSQPTPLTSTTQLQTTTTLLLLALHPQIPLLQLRSLSWGHSFGFGRVAEYAVTGYMFFGVLVALLEGGMGLREEVVDARLAGAPRRMSYLTTWNWERCVGGLCAGGDYDGQAWVHRWVLRDGGAGEGRREGRQGYREILGDLNEVRRYMMVLWRLMVVYDMVVREAGVDPNWEQEVVRALNYLFEFRTEWDMEKNADLFV